MQDPSLECELINRGCFATKAEARLALLHYIEVYYYDRSAPPLGYLYLSNYEWGARNQPES